MPGHYPTRSEFRPHPCGEGEAADASARLFLCACCRVQVLICSCCDRGQIYCAQGCAKERRRSAQRAAGQRYQSSHRGRLKHAARARRYRAQQKNVTHQGSPTHPADDGIAESSAIPPASCRFARPVVREWLWRCHWCGCRCSSFVRNGFLRRRRGADP